MRTHAGRARGAPSCAHAASRHGPPGRPTTRGSARGRRWHRRVRRLCPPASCARPLRAPSVALPEARHGCRRRRGTRPSRRVPAARARDRPQRRAARDSAAAARRVASTQPAPASGLAGRPSLQRAIGHCRGRPDAPEAPTTPEPRHRRATSDRIGSDRHRRATSDRIGSDRHRRGCCGRRAAAAYLRCWSAHARRPSRVRRSPPPGVRERCSRRRAERQGRRKQPRGPPPAPGGGRWSPPIARALRPKRRL